MTRCCSQIQKNQKQNLTSLEWNENENEILWPRKNRNHKFKMGETQKCKSQLAARVNLHIHLITCCIISATTDFTFISILRRTLQWSSRSLTIYGTSALSVTPEQSRPWVYSGSHQPSEYRRFISCLCTRSTHFLQTLVTEVEHFKQDQNSICLLLFKLKWKYIFI